VRRHTILFFLLLPIAMVEVKNKVCLMHATLVHHSDTSLILV
jgi:hypothetical protein